MTDVLRRSKIKFDNPNPRFEQKHSSLFIYKIVALEKRVFCALPLGLDIIDRALYNLVWKRV